MVVATPTRSGLASLVAIADPLRTIGVIGKAKLVLNRIGRSPSYGDYAAAMAQMVPELSPSLEIEVDGHSDYAPLATALLESE